MAKLAKPKKSSWRPSGVVNDPLRPSNRYGEGLDTRRQMKLNAAANRMLAKSKFFSKPEASENEYEPVEAGSIGRNGNLRPTWQGRP